VLVAGITTPAWTPIFAIASVVVSDVGGPLSHGSIVAREYGIPAVVGTGVATRRIHSGQKVQVDGDAGTVTLLEGAHEVDAEQLLLDPVSRALNLDVSTRTVAHFLLATGAVVASTTWWRKRRRS
jgi:phosphoenolpyruvate synthase/pyruvate phosphate dikinase